MPNIIEQYLSLSPVCQTLVRAAYAVSDERALGVLRLDFPGIALREVQTLKDHIAAQKHSA